MKNMWYAIVASVLLNSAVCLQAINVHVVPIAEHNGEWEALLNLPFTSPKTTNWYVFSAEVPDGQEAIDVAKKTVESMTYGQYLLPEDYIEKKESENIFYFFKAEHIPQDELNKVARKASPRPVEKFAWITATQINTGNAVVDNTAVKTEVFQKLKQYVPGVIKEMKATLSGSLNELKNSLNALKTALRQK